MRTPTLFLIIVLPTILFGQNIFRNGSFEEFDRYAEREYCKFNGDEYFTFYVEDWNSGDQLSPDYFTYNPKRPCRLFPLKPHTGYGYIGLATSQSASTFKEYINNELTRPMEVGQNYYLEYWIAPFHESQRLIPGSKESRAIQYLFSNNLGFHFHIQGEVSSIYLGTEMAKEEMQVRSDSIIEIDRGKWRRMSFLYQPDQPYTHVVFGNLGGTTKYSQPPKMIHASNLKVIQEAYYYFDDFFMAKAVADFKRSSSPIPIPLQAVDTEDLLFESLSAEITDAHKTQIIEAWNKVKDSNIINIGISGFADNTGSQAINDSLSQVRAMNTKALLAEIGAPVSIVEITGYGSEKAKADNRTAAGRQRNRRVEVTFNIKDNNAKPGQTQYDKYQPNDRSQMTGDPLVIAHNHLGLSYPLKCLIFNEEGSIPEQVMEINNADQITYGLFKRNTSYRTQLINPLGERFDLPYSH